MIITLVGADCQTIRPPLHRRALDKRSIGGIQLSLSLPLSQRTRAFSERLAAAAPIARRVAVARRAEARVGRDQQAAA